MFFTSVLGFSNVSRGIFYMGQSSILFYVFTGFSFFLPYSIICAEMGASFKNEKGGIYSWIEKSVGGSFGRKLGFITIFMWWFSYVVWMMNVASMITIPLSYVLSPFIDGGFSHATKMVKDLLGPVGMGLIGIVVISLITYLITHGVTKLAKLASVGGIAVMSLNVILIVCSLFILISHGFHPASTYSWADMTTVPKFSKYAGDGLIGMVGLFGFAVYAIFAYGGVEAVGGLVDKLENPEKNVKRGLLIGAGVGIFVYCFGIFAATWFIDRNSVQVMHDIMTTKQGGTGLFYAGNAVYYFMYTLGSTVGSSLHLSASACGTLGNIFAAYTGVSMFCALSGAFFVLIYAPLKQMIEGVPQGIFPASWSKENKNGMPTVALMWQLGLVIFLVLISTLGGDAVADLVQNLVTLTNVTMTVPVIFIIYAYIHYLKNDKVEKPIRIFKSDGTGITMAWCAMLTIGFANLFTVAEPLIHVYMGDDVATNMKEALMSIGGVVVFAIIGWYMVARYERHCAEGKLPMPATEAESSGK
ncbi:amino acid/polyamine/organocation transporter (APC superfamily) [Paludibacterium purpuratum]|uniref:Amino acid/polyamine/organocation transporter (APC superfamily) n=2 Tax=Paludibacterium purpuratum TaxID=1144873 RepID=A0A4R7B795_9NEIS|nr:amino acid/polyamine/organocation transporter (APC superfamily) [Paludibacterium purpuratum]